MMNVFGALRERWNTRSAGATRRMWNREYASGFGGLLETPENREHYLMLTDFLVEAGKNKRILDVCCGQGLLLDFIERCGYEKYVGFDFSEVALESASRRANAKASFVHGQAESFVPEGRFDSIVFNECLYCFADPLRVLQRFEGYLAPEGVMAVSLFTKTERIKAIAADIAKNFKVVRKASVTNATGTWECSLISPGE
jgi:2-polyprenyl-3-methyl-5-hydroxy-6-metoxy-1,4-benzoquinol methylase